jgi:dsRNA-specific ribonuclease
LRKTLAYHQLQHYLRTLAIFYLEPTMPKQPETRHREFLNQRLQKYHFTARFDEYGDGPDHAKIWAYICYIGNTPIGNSTWHTTKDFAKEDAAGQALSWLTKNGYP